MKKKLFFLVSLIATGLKGQSPCINDPADIYAFEVNNIVYEIVKENKSWINASACAVERGGKLAEINSKAEQDTLFYFLKQAGITAANTIAPDGGGASYVWLGGNDLAVEGGWFWDGANMGSFNQFWQGTSSGSAVGGSYTNWGNEPDNWNGQDGLGLAVTNWPLGLAGQWNDVDETNQLYYVIEYPFMIKTFVPKIKATTFFLYPNPAKDLLVIETTVLKSVSPYTLFDNSGRIVLGGQLDAERTQINLSGLPQGLYILLLDNQPMRVLKD